MSLYTFILEFEGGTYISQIDAGTPAAAIAKWCKESNNFQVGGSANSRLKKAIAKSIENNGVAVVSEMVGVFCITCMFRGLLVLGNLIETATPESLRGEMA